MLHFVQKLHSLLKLLGVAQGDYQRCVSKRKGMVKIRHVIEVIEDSIQCTRASALVSSLTWPEH
jgi:hypothetical protein